MHSDEADLTIYWLVNACHNSWLITKYDFNHLFFMLCYLGHNLVAVNFTD